MVGIMSDPPDSRPLDIQALDLQEALVGRYALERELGRGNVGIVYLAHDLRLDRPVALKVLHPEAYSDPSTRRRFLEAARAGARLSHPHVVPIHEVDEVGGHAFLAMSYVRGPSLAHRVGERGPLAGDEALKVVKEVAWALSYAHAESVVHGALRPSNVLLEEKSGRSLVTDFGMGAWADARNGAAAGFLGPERLAGAPPDVLGDLYSLGALGHFCTRGTPPAPPGGAETQGRSQTRGGAASADAPAGAPAQVPAPIQAQVPPTLARVINRCLREAPGDRYADGKALAEALAGDVPTHREVAVPMRLYIQGLRSLSGSIPLVLIAWFLIGLAGVGAAFAWQLGPWVAVVGWLLFGIVTAAPGIGLVHHTRKLLAAGYELDDARRALVDDVARRNEEIRFEYGKEVTAVDRVLRILTWAGLFCGVVGVVADAILNWGGLLEVFNVVAVETGIWSGIIGMFRAQRRRDAPGEGWVAVLKGKLGRWLFKLSGVGLTRPALGSGAARRPTEVAISMAADRLFEELPRALRRDLATLPETVAKLEADAQAMRQQVDALDGLLAEIGDEPWKVGTEDRARLRAELEVTREDARKRMTEAVSALEKIRLGLLRLHAGESDLGRVTAALGTAHEVSLAVDRLLDGRDEVKQMLDERPTPVP